MSSEGLRPGVSRLSCRFSRFLYPGRNGRLGDFFGDPGNPASEYNPSGSKDGKYELLTAANEVIVEEIKDLMTKSESFSPIVGILHMEVNVGLEALVHGVEVSVLLSLLKVIRQRRPCLPAAAASHARSAAGSPLACKMSCGSAFPLLWTVFSSTYDFSLKYIFFILFKMLFSFMKKNALV